MIAAFLNVALYFYALNFFPLSTIGHSLSYSGTASS
jgi:hypothetical protein